MPLMARKPSNGAVFTGRYACIGLQNLAETGTVGKATSKSYLRDSACTQCGLPGCCLKHAHAGGLLGKRMLQLPLAAVEGLRHALHRQGKVPQVGQHVPTNAVIPQRLRRLRLAQTQQLGVDVLLAEQNAQQSMAIAAMAIC